MAHRCGQLYTRKMLIHRSRGLPENKCNALLHRRRWWVGLSLYVNFIWIYMYIFLMIQICVYETVQLKLKFSSHTLLVYYIYIVHTFENNFWHSCYISDTHIKSHQNDTTHKLDKAYYAATCLWARFNVFNVSSLCCGKRTHTYIYISRNYIIEGKCVRHKYTHMRVLFDIYVFNILDMFKCQVCVSFSVCLFGGGFLVYMHFDGFCCNFINVLVDHTTTHIARHVDWDL